MQDIKVAAVSMNGGLGEPRRVLEDITRWCRAAADEGADLVLFPELVVHGHCTPNTWEIAEFVPDGPSTRALTKIAAEFNLFLAAGLSEKEHDIVYNTQVLVGPQGYIGKQRKLHLSRDETLFYKGGRDMPVHDIGICKIGTVICYDSLLPEPSRILALRGAELLLMPHAARVRMWKNDDPESIAAARIHTHQYFSSLAMRARENAVFVLFTNQAGRAGYIDTYPNDSPNQPHHCGGALAFAPDGELLTTTQDRVIRDEMILCEFDAARLATERALPNYTLRTRRPELYEELVKEQVRC